MYRTTATLGNDLVKREKHCRDRHLTSLSEPPAASSNHVSVNHCQRHSNVSFKSDIPCGGCIHVPRCFLASVATSNDCFPRNIVRLDEVSRKHESVQR